MEVDIPLVTYYLLTKLRTCRDLDTELTVKLEHPEDLEYILAEYDKMSKKFDMWLSILTGGGYYEHNNCITDSYYIIQKWCRGGNSLGWDFGCGPAEIPVELNPIYVGAMLKYSGKWIIPGGTNLDRS